jgi:iron complex transport system substrate-binding protein
VSNRIRPLVAVCVLAALAFTACGDDSETASTGSTEAPTSTGAPTTTTEEPGATTTTAAGAPSAFAEGSPEAAAAEAYRLVFDSAVPFADKSAHLDDAAALQATVEQYGEAGTSFGGITLEPTAITITGETAAVTYDVYFGTAPQYEGLTGAIENRDGTWTVTRGEFCGFMASARTPCAAA